MPFNTLLQKTGLVAILRGVKPDEIVAIGEKLYAAGFRLIEIPMNSPEAVRIWLPVPLLMPPKTIYPSASGLSINLAEAVLSA